MENEASICVVTQFVAVAALDAAEDTGDTRELSCSDRTLAGNVINRTALMAPPNKWGT
jgi:hypothetical protein